MHTVCSNKPFSRVNDFHDHSTLVLNLSSCDAWQIDCLSNSHFSNYKAEIALAKELAEKHLPLEFKERCQQFNQTNGCSYIHIAGLPQDPQLPLTPYDGLSSASKPTHVSERVLLGLVGFAFDAEPFSYQEQKEGELIQQVVPIKGRELTNSNASSTKFGWHSDDASIPRNLRAEGIALYALRNEKTATYYAPVDNIVAELNRIDPRHEEVFRQKRFRVRTPESFTVYGGKVIQSEPRPLITEGQSGTEIALALYNVEPADKNDDEAQMAILALRLVLECPSVAESFVLKPGEALIISNLKGLHARDPITGDRWLQRCYFRQDLSHLRAVTQTEGRVFPSEPLVLL